MHVIDDDDEIYVYMRLAFVPSARLPLIALLLFVFVMTAQMVTYPHLDLDVLTGSEITPIWYNAAERNVLEDVLGAFGVTSNCEVNALSYPCFQDLAIAQPPSTLECGQTCCAWDENIHESKA